MEVMEVMEEVMDRWIDMKTQLRERFNRNRRAPMTVCGAAGFGVFGTHLNSAWLSFRTSDKRPRVVGTKLAPYFALGPPLRSFVQPRIGT